MMLPPPAPTTKNWVSNRARALLPLTSPRALVRSTSPLLPFSLCRPAPRNRLTVDSREHGRGSSFTGSINMQPVFATVRGAHGQS
eukprot:scaffold131301_cov32-Tisochrysis_lutea.AAC.8